MCHFRRLVAGIKTKNVGERLNGPAASWSFSIDEGDDFDADVVRDYTNQRSTKKVGPFAI